MSSIESLWRALEAEGHAGGARRVDDRHPSDLYAALDAHGQPGLVFVTSSEVPEPPLFGSVEATVSRRSDGRSTVGLWLRAEPLRGLFAKLCQDLVEASRDLAPAAVPAFLLSRLLRWRRLLEARGDGLLSQTELRGLVGELAVFRHLLAGWPAGEVVRAWAGPLGAHQDFALPLLRVEVKAIHPGASTTRISSADQLDVADAELLLAVVTLPSASPDGSGESAAALVSELRDSFAEERVRLEFDSLLAAAGYRDAEAYERRFFRVEALQFFAVREAFPRLARSSLPVGVAEVVYDIELGACRPYRTEVRGPLHGA